MNTCQHGYPINNCILCEFLERYLRDTLGVTNRATKELYAEELIAKGGFEDGEVKN